MKRRNLLKNICMMMVAMLSLSSCGMVIGWEEDMDVKQSMKFFLLQRGEICDIMIDIDD